MDFEYLFHKICQRRGVTLKEVRSVAFAMRVNFGLATGTALIAAAANTFYYVKKINYAISSPITNQPILRFTNYGGGSNGDVDWTVTNGNAATYVGVEDVECDSITYIVNTFTAGAFTVFGTVLKITYSA